HLSSLAIRTRQGIQVKLMALEVQVLDVKKYVELTIEYRGILDRSMGRKVV
ncbi:11496_t:CDS:2, partial [Dentiscutata erythropus]